MPAIDEDDRPKKKVAHEIGQDLTLLSVGELGERIQQTMDVLPPEYRLLLLLVADEELSYEEIAELTGQSANAVRGKLHRARKAFAARFAKTD